MKIVEYQNAEGHITIRGETSDCVYDRIEVGTDGNCGYALFGPNIQEGEVAFVPIDLTMLNAGAERTAWGEALYLLRAQLGHPLPYFVRGN